MNQPEALRAVLVVVFCIVPPTSPVKAFGYESLTWIGLVQDTDSKHFRPVCLRSTPDLNDLLLKSRCFHMEIRSPYGLTGPSSVCRAIRPHRQCRTHSACLSHELPVNRQPQWTLRFPLPQWSRGYAHHRDSPGDDCPPSVAGRRFPNSSFHSKRFVVSPDS